MTLRNGEKVNGQLIDLGGVGYTVRVNGNERQIPQNDVAVIDFTGGLTDADWTNFTGTSKIILRNGQTFDGSLYDIGGASPLRLTIRTSNGEREVSSNEVARIVISRPDNAVGTTGNTGIASTPPWRAPSPSRPTSPGRRPASPLRKGQRFTLSSTGEMQLSDDVNDIANVNGSKAGRTIANGPLPNGLAGCAGRQNRPERRAVRHRIGPVHPGSRRRAALSGRQRRPVWRQPGQLPGRRPVDSRGPWDWSAGRPPSGDRPFLRTIGRYPCPTGRTRSTCPARGSR